MISFLEFRIGEMREITHRGETMQKTFVEVPTSCYTLNKAVGI